MITSVSQGDFGAPPNGKTGRLTAGDQFRPGGRITIGDEGWGVAWVDLLIEKVK